MSTRPSVMQERLVASNDADLFVRSVGDSQHPVLMAIHGGPGLSHEYLTPLEHLASLGLCVVTYDQRGVGRSTGRPVLQDPVLDYATDLNAVRQAIGAKTVHLLAHSGGGLTAMSYASLYPEHVESIVFVDSIAPTASAVHAGLARFGSRITALQASGHIPADLPPNTPDDGTAQLLAILPAYFADPTHPAAGSLNGATFRPRVFESVMQALGDFDLRQRLAHLTMPILSIEAETPFGIGMAGQLGDALPQGDLHRVRTSACGHLPWSECPDWFFGTVRSFLQPLLGTSSAAT